MSFKTFQIFALLLAISGSLYAPSAYAEAKNPYAFEVNQSFLSDRETGTESEEKENLEVQTKIYGSSLSKKLTQEYLDLNRDFDMKQKYGLNSSFMMKEQGNKNSGFGRYMMRHVLSFQVTESLKKAEKVSSEGRTIKRTHDTIQNLIQNSTRFDLSDHFKFGTKTDLPGQRGQLWMRSSLLDLDLNGVMGGGYSLVPMTDAPSVGSDHLYLNANRDLGIFGLESRMSYGFNTTRMNHSLSKKLAPNLSAEIATTRGLSAGKSGMNRSEESIRMNYGLRF